MSRRPTRVYMQFDLWLYSHKRMQSGTQQLTVVLLVAVSLQQVACFLTLEEKYPFSRTLDDGFTLHWKFDLGKQTITFAGNVSRRGWIGFGISPDGMMIDSDVVIGWVNHDGKSQFHDRYAILSYILPPIDKSQDWKLLNSQQDLSGNTILEFTRDLITCDEKDLDIKAGDINVVWAYHSLGPDSLTTLDSLPPERLGSAKVKLLRVTDDNGKEISDDVINKQLKKCETKNTEL